MGNIRWIQRLENFKLANSNLKETCDCIKNTELNRIYTMAIVQAFEMSFELACKTMKDYLEYTGTITENSRNTIKESLSQNIISDGELWIEMMEIRNKTSHAYRQDFAKQTAENIIKYYVPLLNTLQEFFESKTNG